MDDVAEYRAPIRGKLTAADRGAKLIGRVLAAVVVVVSLALLAAWPAGAGVVLVGGFVVLLVVLRATAGSFEGGYREVKAAESRLCLRCRYPLTERAEGWGCPECGGCWDQDMLERSWRWTYLGY